MPITNQRIKRYRDNPIVIFFGTVLFPIFVYALLDVGYWDVLYRDFGLKNSWYLFVVNLQTIRNGAIYTYTYPNSPFLLFLIVLISVNIFYYVTIKRIKQETQIQAKN